MTREEIKERIKSDVDIEKYAEKSKRGLYICPHSDCNSGTGKNQTGAVKIYRETNTAYCHACEKSVDQIDFYMKRFNVDYNTALENLARECGIDIHAEAARTPAEARKGQTGRKTSPAVEMPHNKPQTPTEPQKDFTEYLRECHAHINDLVAVKYLSFRGISQDTAARFGLGYDIKTGFLIIPTSKHFYVGRNTNTEANFRYNNAQDATAELFNTKVLYNDDGRPVFICEGAFDALSVIEAGGLAVALNSGGNYKKLLDIIKKKPTSSTLILWLDNDEKGQKYTKNLVEGLQGLNISHIRHNICPGHKDANEALTADKTAFFEAVRAAERRAAKPDNTSDYISLFMAGDIEKLKKDAKRKTGFSNIDTECGGVYPGLYAVGGISAVGKTTFIYQMADQMAAAGQHVLFFSLEQSRLEMVSKSIARMTAQNDVKTAVSSLAIRTGNLTPAVLDAADRYSESVGGRLSVIEGNFNCTVSFIGEYTRRYIAENKVNPVIIVDYLQVMQPDKDPETGRKPTDTKQIVDYNVTQLKRMSRSLDIPIFVISSLNRSNYLTPVDFEAFKESGGIEYTADVVWGLQLAVMNDEIFDKESKVKEKREKVKEAKAAVPREIELVCLKNRYGRNYNVNFTYYPQFDLFIGKEADNTPRTPRTAQKW